MMAAPSSLTRSRHGCDLTFPMWKQSGRGRTSRCSYVDDPMVLRGVMKALAELSRQMPLVFPVHPRTRKRLEEMDGGGQPLSCSSGIHYAAPLGYLDFIALVAGSRLVLTDSGGLQEETTALNVPCLNAAQRRRNGRSLSATEPIGSWEPPRIVSSRKRPAC
jgi:UDP-N-acetylglucosamine 2-epimerase (non-hydrolysing)